MKYLLAVATVLLGLPTMTPRSQAEELAVRTVTPAQAPEVTLDVPYGWTACDEATRKQLSAQSPGMESCPQFDDSGGAAVMIGAPDASILVSFAFAGPAAGPSIGYLNEEQLGVMAKRACTERFAVPPHLAQYCQFSIVDFAGGRALDIWVLWPETALQIGRTFMFPLRNGTGVMIFAAPSPTRETNQQINSIMSSVRVNGQGWIEPKGSKGSQGIEKPDGAVSAQLPATSDTAFDPVYRAVLAVRDKQAATIEEVGELCADFFQRSGLDTLFDTKRLEKDKGFMEADAIIERAHRGMDECAQRTQKLPEVLENIVKDAPLSASIKEQFLAEMVDLPKQMTGLQESIQLQTRILTALEAAFHILRSGAGFRVTGGELIFNDPSDEQAINALGNALAEAIKTQKSAPTMGAHTEEQKPQQ